LNTDIWDFSGRTAVVTGGMRGIGRSISEELLLRGAEVHVFDSAPSTGGSDAGWVYHKVDVSDPKSVSGAVAELPPNTNLLINNAGITRDRSLAKMSDEEWQSVISVNLTGAFHMIRAMIPLMRAAGNGRIVNIASINGLRGKFGQANYSAAKAGLIGLTKTSARELGPKNITVNAVAPGLVLTDMTLRMPEQFRKEALAEMALSHAAEPKDIAYAVLFLLSDAARMITGEVLKVDGGQYI
jgi:acetoacetyl-CoA reductase/3-oxoacyl-[acyl-carrier protein] reductase